MRQATDTLTVATHGEGLTEITPLVRRFITGTGIETGLLTLFCQHTSASLLVQENADPDVHADLLDFFRRIAPQTATYRHHSEGPDDMPAHLRAALTQVQLSIPVSEGEAVLGTWQGIYVFEHRATPHRRQISMHIIGE